MKLTIHQKKIIALFCIYLFLFLLALTREPFGQNLRYHNFADIKAWAFVPNFWNVISNLSFLCVALWGLFYMKRLKQKFSLMNPVFIYLLGIGLTSIGSAYYHWNPNNLSLVWDRLPMTFGFNGFLLCLISHRVSQKLARNIMWPILLIGSWTVFYWGYTETLGRGDLRFYFLTQAADILLILVILVIFPKKEQSGKLILGALGFYAFAIFLEQKDHQVYRFLNEWVGGHPLKHLMAGVATGLLGWWAIKYSPTTDELKKYSA